jgi:hypothetical protein
MSRIVMYVPNVVDRIIPRYAYCACMSDNCRHPLKEAWGLMPFPEEVVALPVAPLLYSGEALVSRYLCDPGRCGRAWRCLRRGGVAYPHPAPVSTE